MCRVDGISGPIFDMSGCLRTFLHVILVSVCVQLSQGVHYSPQWAVQIEGGSQVADIIAAKHGFVNHGEIFPDWYHFHHNSVARRSVDPSLDHHENLVQESQVKWAKQQVVRSRRKRDYLPQRPRTYRMSETILSDPRWPLMWYLNRGGGLDMNVQPAWKEGITGRGVVVTILDDGLEKTHPDLLLNYDPQASYDVNNHDEDPMPRYDMIDSNRHGTRCAGEVAATANNSLCAVGVAFGASVGGSFNSIPCIAHTLQLVVKDGCLSKREYSTVVAICRKIVGHFKHSAKATKLLKSAQKALGIPEHKLVQDEPTRWNSTYDLLVRLIEQRKAVTCVMQDLKVGNDLSLTSSNWAMIESFVDVLKVFNDVTKTVSSAVVTVSEVIPIVNGIKVTLREIFSKQGTGTRAIINDMIASLDARYRGYETKPLYAIATLLDPRFKLEMFSDPDNAENAKVKLIQEMELDEELLSRNVEMEDHADVLEPEISVSTQNPVKSLYRKMLDSGSNTRTKLRRPTFKDKLNDYLMEALMDDEENCQDNFVMAYWSVSRFHSLKKFARKYLGTPPATVFSERLFSTSGIICDRKRSRLDTERVRQLVFLCKNLPLVKYQY